MNSHAPHIVESKEIGDCFTIAELGIEFRIGAGQSSAEVWLVVGLPSRGKGSIAFVLPLAVFLQIDIGEETVGFDGVVWVSGRTRYLAFHSQSVGVLILREVN